MIEISVIIPTFRPKDYLWECLNSLSCQSFDTEKIEIILVLNGEKDGYYSLISDFVYNNMNNIAVTLKYTPIPNVSVARNIGLDCAKGRYICFIDDDDIVSANYLEELFICSNEKDISVSNVYAFYDSIEEKQVDYLTFKDTTETLLKNRSYLSNACCKMIPRLLIGKYRFNTAFSHGEDAIFMFQISDGIEKVIKSSANCIYYRRLRKNSASRKRKTFIEKCRLVLTMQCAFTSIYFSRFLKYNFLLYVSRLLAVYKMFSFLLLFA